MEGGARWGTQPGRREESWWRLGWSVWGWAMVCAHIRRCQFLSSFLQLLWEQSRLSITLSGSWRHSHYNTETWKSASVLDNIWNLTDVNNLSTEKIYLRIKVQLKSYFSLNPSISIQLLFICLFLRKALVFRLHDFTPDFHSLTFFWKSQTNANIKSNRIQGKSVLVYMCDNHAVCVIKDGDSSWNQLLPHFSLKPFTYTSILFQLCLRDKLQEAKTCKNHFTT